MDFNNYVKTEKKKIRKEKLEFISYRTKSILNKFFGSIWGFVKKRPYQLFMVFIISSILMPFLSIVLMLLFKNNYMLNISIYLAFVSIICFLIEAMEEDSNYTSYNWENVGKCFIRDVIFFIIVNMITILYGQFVIGMFYV